MPPPQRSNRQVLGPDAQPCIWMSAGLLTYKLCDRAFDCERCPLDSALAGHARAKPPAEVAAVRRSASSELFDDRSYGMGHTWVLATGDTLRVGLDAFAAQLIDSVREILGPRRGTQLMRGDTLCIVETEIGSVIVRAPFSGEVLATNSALRRDPRLLLRAPYDEGWLVELTPAHAQGWRTELVSCEAQRDAVRLDLQRFRRQVAMQLLASSVGVGATLPDGGERLTTLPQMLGPGRYLEIVQELLT